MSEAVADAAVERVAKDALTRWIGRRVLLVVGLILMMIGGSIYLALQTAWTISEGIQRNADEVAGLRGDVDAIQESQSQQAVARDGTASQVVQLVAQVASIKDAVTEVRADVRELRRLPAARTP